jgi:hypothetical protein
MCGEMSDGAPGVTKNGAYTFFKPCDLHFQDTTTKNTLDGLSIALI